MKKGLRNLIFTGIGAALLYGIPAYSNPKESCRNDVSIAVQGFQSSKTGWEMDKHESLNKLLDSLERIRQKTNAGINFLFYTDNGSKTVPVSKDYKGKMPVKDALERTYNPELGYPPVDLTKYDSQRSIIVVPSDTKNIPYAGTNGKTERLPLSQTGVTYLPNGGKVVRYSKGDNQFGESLEKLLECK